jgi:hypothetical protein
MKHTTLRHVITGTLAGTAVGLAAAFPGAAFADTPGSATTAQTPSTPAVPSHPNCTPADFTQAQQAVETELSDRVTQLNTLLSAVDNTSNHLTPADAQTLQNDISTVELPGIQALQPQVVAQATTCAELRADAHAMVFNFRVYLVMTPQTHLTIVVDDETYIEGRFVTLEPNIASAIQKAQAHGKNVAAAQAAFGDLQNQVTAAQNTTTGLSAQILAQTPQGYPGNHQVFVAALTSTTNAHTDLHAAYGDANQIKTDLS